MAKDVNPEVSALWRGFERSFELSLATTEAQRQAVYRFRYRIFCEKLGFIDPRPLPDRRETDDFDEHSIHCFVKHRVSGRIAGCVRLVTADASTDMPLERHCEGLLDPVAQGHIRTRRSQIAEVSRLAVDRPFTGSGRQKSREPGASDVQQLVHEEQQTFPLTTAALMAAAYASADMLGRTECFALMERSLRARLRRIGIKSTRVGGDIEYRGTVAPYRLDGEAALRTLPENLRAFYARVHRQVAESIGPAGSWSTHRGRTAEPGHLDSSLLKLGAA